MRTTLVFDADGSCTCAVNDDVLKSDFPGAAKVLYVSLPITANEVWYDHANGQMLFRKPFVTKVEANKLSMLPVGTRATVGNVEVVVDDGVLDLEVDYPQAVKVLLRHPRWLDTEVEVPCEAAG